MSALRRQYPNAPPNMDDSQEGLIDARRWLNFGTVTGINCIAALKALGEETRLRILRLLFKEQLSVSEISARLKASQYNVSKHERLLHCR